MTATQLPAQYGINGQRLLEMLEQLGTIGWGSNGVTRVALDDEDRRGRDFVVARMKALSLEVRVDQVGNIYGIRAARDGSLDSPVITGSHIDSVIGAGKLDGCYGVLAGLEAIAVLNENGIETTFPLAVAVYTNEEGIRYQPDMMGSLIAAGGLTVEEALDITGNDGSRFGDELARIGYAGHEPPGFIQPHAFVELHIEQGPVLDTSGEQIGVVQDLQGISWTQLDIKGQANHAGTTPMSMRKDAGYAASAVIAGVRQIATDMGGSQVATAGTISFTPNAINVVPSSARLTIDLRNSNEALLVQAEEQLEDLIGHISESEDVGIESQRLARFQPVRFDEGICSVIAGVADQLGLTARKMTSGAGHDAQMMARVCPSAMIFVPSVKGISHNMAEHTEPEDLINGANTLLHVLLELAAD